MGNRRKDERNKICRPNLNRLHRRDADRRRATEVEIALSHRRDYAFVSRLVSIAVDGRVKLGQRGDGENVQPEQQ